VFVTSHEEMSGILHKFENLIRGCYSIFCCYNKILEPEEAKRLAMVIGLRHRGLRS
jgi:hypothetical protein